MPIKKRQNNSTSNNLLAKNTDLIICAIIFIFGFYLNYCLAFRLHTFQVVDNSLVLDMAWKILNGQKPFDDFATIQALSPAVLEAGFLRLFGVSFNTQVLHVSAINGAASLLVFIALRLIGGGYVIPVIMAVFTAFIFYPPQKLSYAVQHGVFFCLIGLVLAIWVERRKSSLLFIGIMWGCIGALVALSFLSKQTTLALVLALLPFLLFQISRTTILKAATFVLGALVPFSIIILISSNSVETIFQMQFYLIDLAVGLGSVRITINTLDPFIIFDLSRNPLRATILMTIGVGILALYFAYKSRRTLGSSSLNISLSGNEGNVFIILSGLGLMVGTVAIAWVAWWPQQNLMQLSYCALGIVSIGLLNSLANTPTHTKIKSLDKNVIFSSIVVTVVGWEVGWVHPNINLRSGFPNTPQLVGDPHNLTHFMLPQMAGVQFRSLETVGPERVTIGVNKIRQELEEAQEIQEFIQKLDRNVLLVGLPKFHYAYAGIVSPLPVAQLIPGGGSPTYEMKEYKGFLQKLDTNMEQYNIEDILFSAASYAEHREFIKNNGDLFCQRINGKQVVHVQMCDGNGLGRSRSLAHIIGADRKHYLKLKGYQMRR